MPTFEKVCAEVEATPAYNKRTTEQIYNHFRELAERWALSEREKEIVKMLGTAEE